MNSMTGFGYAEGESSGVQLSVEIKSLNNRFLDLIISLPAALSMLERQIRDVLHGHFLRGRLEITVRARDIEEAPSVRVDEAAAAEWKAALERLSAFLGTQECVSLELLTRQEGVFRVTRGSGPGAEVYWKALKLLISAACSQVQADRHREGRQLKRDIGVQIGRIRESLERIGERAHEIKAEVEAALRSRFYEVLGDEFGEQRVFTETASWIARTDINEEIVRLEAHIAAFAEESKGGGGAATGGMGRKLDFLAQEMGREINTIGSKTPRADVGRRVVDMKDALEKVREQLRNVE